MERKYRMTEETLEVMGHTLHRIIAERDFGFVKRGDKGGLIESESNLSHSGEAWVSGDAKVLNSAKVWEKAHVFGNAMVRGEAEIGGGAKVYGDAQVYDEARVWGEASVSGRAKVYGRAFLAGKALVSGFALVHETAILNGRCQISDEAEVRDALIGDEAVIGQHAIIMGNAHISGEAYITRADDYQVFRTTVLPTSQITWTRSDNKYRMGDFHGSALQLMKLGLKMGPLICEEFVKAIKVVDILFPNKDSKRALKLEEECQGLPF